MSSVTLTFHAAHGKVKMVPPVVRFDYLNFATNVTVAVLGVDDNVDQGAIHGDSIYTSLFTEDSLFECLEADRPHCGLAARYFNFTIPRMNVTVVDDDEAGVKVSSVSVGATYDNFGDALEAGHYTVCLGTKPLGNVLVNLSGLSVFSTAVPPSIVFTESTWNVPTLVAVAAAAPTHRRPICPSGNRFCDFIENRTEIIFHTSESSDPLYDSINVPNIKIRVSVSYDATDPPKSRGGNSTTCSTPWLSTLTNQRIGRGLPEPLHARGC